MKKINFEGREFFYEVKDFDCGEYGGITGYNTEFYDGPTVSYRKMFWLFGKTIKVEAYNPIFIVDCNIENPFYTKEQIHKEIAKKVKILDRKEEIEKGKII